MASVRVRVRPCDGGFVSRQPLLGLTFRRVDRYRETIFPHYGRALPPRLAAARVYKFPRPKKKPSRSFGRSCVRVAREFGKKSRKMGDCLLPVRAASSSAAANDSYERPPPRAYVLIHTYANICMRSTRVKK